MTSSNLMFALLSVLFLGTATASGLGEGENCAHAPKSCNPPLNCLGFGKHRFCFMKKGLGMVCGLDPYWICEDGLICQDTCKKPVGERGSCNSRNEGCRPPLSCVGLPGNKKCFMKKGLGEVCGKDPFWVCQDGLTCEHNRCRKTVMGKAGSCNLPGQVCQRPYKCIGNEGNKKCFETKGIGELCGKGPFDVCERHLFCDGICKATVGKGGFCSTRFKICHPSLRCDGPPGKKKCVIRRKGLGMMCDDNPLDPYWWCEEDLICDDGVCKKPVGEGGECNNPNAGCEPPFSCVGRPGNKKCFKKRGKGETCPDPFWVCGDGLICDADKICKKAVGVGGICDSNFQICRTPLSCDRFRGGKKCFKSMGEGKPCGVDPFWRCADGLSCVKSICKAH